MGWELEDLEAFGSISESASQHSPQGIFAIRGDLDGEEEEDYTEKEQFIGLKLGEEEFLLPISVVSDLVMLPRITFVPGGPDLIEGVMNLRGKILPAVNLRKMMGLERNEPTSTTRVIIVKIEDMNFGIIVDAITYVVALLDSEIESQNLSSKHRSSELISHIAKRNERVLGVFDVQKILNTVRGEFEQDNVDLAV